MVHLASFLAKCLSVLQNYLVPGNLSNLSFLAGAEQVIYRSPPLVAFLQGVEGAGISHHLYGKEY